MFNLFGVATILIRNMFVEKAIKKSGELAIRLGADRDVVKHSQELASFAYKGPVKFTSKEIVNRMGYCIPSIPTNYSKPTIFSQSANFVSGMVCYNFGSALGVGLDAYAGNTGILRYVGAYMGIEFSRKIVEPSARNLQFYFLSKQEKQGTPIQRKQGTSIQCKKSNLI